MKDINIVFKKFIDIYNEEKDERDKVIDLKKKLGSGTYGTVREVQIMGKKYAAKVFKKEKIDENALVKEFKGPNIIKIIYVNSMEISNINYNFVIMEKADLEDLSTIMEKIFTQNKLKIIINSPFEGETSDNLIRFFSYEFIKGLEIFDRKDYCHFDIKPNNILMFKYLIPKLSDFSLLRSTNQIINKKGYIEIPGGTSGYLSPEYYYEEKLNLNAGKKQDYFAIGSTIYQLKYGVNMIPYEKYEHNIKTADYIIDLIQRAKDMIKSKKNSDKDFIKFLCSLIDYKWEERPNFEEIYRDKWLNKNLNDVKKCYKINFLDTDKLFIELNKSDFILNKKNQLKKNRKRFNFNKNKHLRKK